MAPHAPTSHLHDRADAELRAAQAYRLRATAHPVVTAPLLLPALSYTMHAALAIGTRGAPHGARRWQAMLHPPDAHASLDASEHFHSTIWAGSSV